MVMFAEPEEQPHTGEPEIGENGRNATTNGNTPFGGAFDAEGGLNETLKDIEHPNFRDYLRAQRRASMVFPTTSRGDSARQSLNLRHSFAKQGRQMSVWEKVALDIEDELLAETDDDINDSEHGQAPPKIHWYAPPVQRQRWGEDQVLPHIDWSDLFFDLFYVAAAYNLGVMLISATNEDDWVRGIIYFIGIFGPLYISWETDTYYSSRYTVVDQFHSLFAMTKYLVIAIAILHITPLNLLGDVEHSIETFSVTIAIFSESIMHLLLNIELYYIGCGDREAIRCHTGRKIRNQLLPTCFIYLAATICAAVFYFGTSDDASSTKDEKSQQNDYETDKAEYDGRFLAATDYAYANKKALWETTDLPFTLTAIGYVSNIIYTAYRKIRVTDGKHGDIRVNFVPNNVEFLIHRYGEWIMLMIGESVLSLLIVDTVENREYYVIAILGALTVIALQALKFQSEPKHAASHALWRNIRNGTCYSILIQVLSIGLITFGVSFKIFLSTVVQEEADKVKVRFLAAAPVVSDRVSTILFCASLALVLVSLELMMLTHRGMRKNWNEFFRQDDSAHGPLVFISVLKLCALVFLICFPFWNTDPTSVTIMGLLIVVGIVTTRIASWAFLYHESEIKNAAKKFMASVNRPIKTGNAAPSNNRKAYFRGASEWVSKEESDVGSTSTTFGDIYDQIFDAIIVSDLEGNIVKVNETAVSIFGYEEKSDLVGQNVKVIVGNGHAAHHDKYIQRFKNSENSESSKLGMQRVLMGRKRDGEEIPVIIGVKRSTKGHYLVAYIRDMSGVDMSRLKSS